ncbi:conserved hypothetical protein [Uncinocarpus reesii 1704]|uniref:PH domain-containing protein n=1 Tax=Uncinocarpus reesii (strain UAMH 1704) TaxID=336963 RepID=C4JV21_UNCRE|nr:uncharacterized protein UREG_04974 [Uncinocarpus reesii 1704]EEP80132.1 conserved hypothetical protein [Uncinocarpus reesii 1704]
MASKVIGALSKKVLKESAENRFGQEDPYFEQVPATNLLGRPTTKKRRKAAPEGISDYDAKILTKVKRRAYRLDLCLCNCCGIKFGWSSVIGLVPAFGDVLDMVLALMVVKTCSNIEGGLPGSLYLHMLANVIFDFVIGLVPFIGDLADALYKCNTRNAVLLERFLKEKGKRNLKHQNQAVIESGDTTPRNDSPRRPERAQLPRENSRPGNNGRSDRRREPDLEMGMR